jgi:aspartate/methionine/tyrosine aminotransferase
MFSRRGGDPGKPNAVDELLAGARREGAQLIDLSESNPTRAGLVQPSDALRQALAPAGAFDYDPAPLGLASARQTVSTWLDGRGIPLPPGRIVLTASTSEAYGFLLKLLCDPGDEVLVPQPSYPLIEHLCRLEGVSVRPYTLRYDGEYHLDRNELLALRTSRTRAVLVISPNNPTGNFLKREEAELLRELDLPVICDEVFGEYAFGADPRRLPSALLASGLPVFSLFGLSKSAGLPGLKLSWIGVGGPDTFCAAALERLELIADTYLSVATPVQLALPELLRFAGTTRAAIQERVALNLAHLRAAIGPESSVSLIEPEGGWYATLRLPALRDEDGWMRELIARERVYIHPGYFYDFASGPLLVRSLLPPPELFARGVERILGAVQRVLENG